QGDEWLAVEGEADGQDLTFLRARIVGRRAVDAVDPAVGKDRGVERRSLFGLPVIEPEEWGDGRHQVASLAASGEGSSIARGRLRWPRTSSLRGVTWALRTHPLSFRAARWRRWPARRARAG